ncbi:MAG TPA: glucose-1-phosphate adenylyltransferase [Planctomycetaceae bacterium]|nr:glucose-1-phosphate adenylyltransferase [Planctomycetaceae bacterium]
MLRNTTAVVLAGGKGTRLEPLTLDRAKPAVPFGGEYRIVDFVLSNAINSGLRRLLVLTQYKALSLDRHINLGWRKYFCSELGEFLDVVPPQQRIDEQWYQGTADAVYQNIFVIEKDRPEYVVVLAGDHIYKMNYESMVRFHKESEADLTVGALTVDRESAKQFGVIQADEQGRIQGFQEKPSEPMTLPGEDNLCYASMGIYVFTARFLFEQLCRDATEPGSEHDFGKNIIPSIIDSHRVFAFPFRDENRKQQAYWRDVGTIDAYYEANMDLIDVDPQLNLYDQDWPIRTLQANMPPPKFVFGSDGDTERCGQAIDSIVCAGTVISGGKVRRSVISPDVRVNSYANVDESILFQGVNVGRHARIRRAIIDKDVHIPADMEIGYDLELDRRRGFCVSPSGIVIISRNDSPATVDQMLLADPPAAVLR